jgi:hypothetical protein
MKMCNQWRRENDESGGYARLANLEPFRYQPFWCRVSANRLRCFFSASRRMGSALACRNSAEGGANSTFDFTEANEPTGSGMWRHRDDPS